MTWLIYYVSEQQRLWHTRRLTLTITVCLYDLYLFHMGWFIWATSRENVSSRIFDQVRFKPACSATKASYNLETLDIASIHIILAEQWTTKVLIRLHGCAGWSAPLLFAYGIRHVFAWPSPFKGCVVHIENCHDWFMPNSYRVTIFPNIFFWAAVKIDLKFWSQGLTNPNFRWNLHCFYKILMELRKSKHKM